MPWTQRNDKLIGTNGEILDLWPQEFWYLAPARVTYTPGEGVVRPLEFAVLLHNAVKGEGLVTSLDVLLSGIEPSTEKRGAAAEAEALLEETRQSVNPALPSRLRSYFLNYDRAVAERRSATMFRDSRRLVRCYLIRNGGRYHFADVDVYERLEGRPDDRVLAAKYWELFQPKTEDELHRLEVLADSALYFPDWQEFPTLDDRVLMRWSLDNPTPQREERG
ncbi:hypothetical protein [Azoarcus taiwanensis]|uniref:Uncharacterized protein n=1 Tax=Azoarcus taiwanensis TaxID=666964 RepID=A0A972FFU0_9RHOO|nr:hypothetical protein [Azoarcus taiwanensis]NMG04803.1 hypothetical protein [Azoarcus taiwanensis]